VNPNFRFNKQVAIVTGAGDGIGRGIALGLAHEGAAVAVCARREANVAETASLLRAAGARAIYEFFDGAEEAAVARFVARVTAELGAPTVLVANASTMPFGELEELSAAEMDLCYGSKLKSAALFAKHCIAPMKDAGRGSMVFMGSVAGNRGFARFAYYGAMNSAIIGLARGLAIELAPYGIRVNSVSPGTVDAPMLHRFEVDLGVDQVKLRADIDASHPRGRIATIPEIVAPFLFLASDDAANITGLDLHCDGGVTAKGG